MDNASIGLLVASNRQALSIARHPIPPLTDASRSTWSFYVDEDIVFVGYDEEGDKRYGVKFSVVAINDYGERFHHVDLEWDRAVAERFALNMSTTRSPGLRRSSSWTRGEAVYGSLYYEHSGAEYDQLSREIAEG